MKDYKLLVCLDFDGVIHSYDSGWKGASVIPDKPVPGAIEAILNYLDAGFRVAISSTRSKNIFGRRAMKRYVGNAIAEYWHSGGNNKIYEAECECWGDAYDLAYSRIEWPWFKPSAFIHIDDRAITFSGIWPSPQELKAFKPWNKRKISNSATV